MILKRYKSFRHNKSLLAAFWIIMAHAFVSYWKVHEWGHVGALGILKKINKKGTIETNGNISWDSNPFHREYFQLILANFILSILWQFSGLKKPTVDAVEFSL